jgi:hypothetical protein
MPTLEQIHDLAATKAEVNRLAALVAAASGNVVAAVGTRLLFGAVASDGTLISGGGFTSARTGTGAYTVTYTTPFSVDATLVPVSLSGDARATTEAVSTFASSVVKLWNNAGAAADRAFGFVAVGPA